MTERKRKAETAPVEKSTKVVKSTQKKQQNPNGYRLDDEQTESALKALLKHVKVSQQAAENGVAEPLFKEASVSMGVSSGGVSTDDTVWLVLATKKIAATASVKARQIPLPHPFRRVALNSERNTLTSTNSIPSVDVCLIVKDPHKAIKEQLIALGAQGPRVKVIGVSKLGKEYRSFEMRRQLCAAYDVFLADDRVIPMLPRLLGKTFFSKKKQPVPIKVTKQNLASDIAEAVSNTYYFATLGACTSIKIGTVQQTVEQLKENAIAVAEAVARKLPQGGWGNVHSWHIKTGTSLALPVYLAGVGSGNVVEAISAEAKALTEEKFEPGTEIAVAKKAKKSLKSRDSLEAPSTPVNTETVSKSKVQMPVKKSASKTPKRV